MKQYLTFAILLELATKEKLTAKELSTKYEISTRTVYRYLNELESAGIPTYTQQGRNGGIGIEKNFALESLVLTKKDKALIKLGLDMLNNPETEVIVKKLSL